MIVKKLIRRWSISSSARCCDRHALLMISWFTTISQKNVSDNGSDWCSDTTRRIPLCIGLRDCKKAFDIVHHSTLWKILRHYGLPHKIVDLISILYQNVDCSAMMEINQTNIFSVRSGVCQGCILSPILFIITLDYRRQTT